MCHLNYLVELLLSQGVTTVAMLGTFQNYLYAVDVSFNERNIVFAFRQLLKLIEGSRNHAIMIAGRFDWLKDIAPLL